MYKKDRHIRMKEVISTTGRSRSSIYEKISDDYFPSPVVVDGSNFSAWSENDIQLYLLYVSLFPKGTKWSEFLEEADFYGL